LAPARAYIIGAAVAAVCSVQSLIHNVVLLSAIVGSAATVCIGRRKFRRAALLFGLLALGILSFIPYRNAYVSGSSWSQIVEFPVTFRLLWHQFNFALGNP